MRVLRRQRALLEFALASLLRHRGKTVVLGAVLTLIVFLLTSLAFLRSSVRLEAAAMLREAPDLIVQRLVAGRQELVPQAAVAAVRTIPGVARAQGRLWGYYYDAAGGRELHPRRSAGRSSRRRRDGHRGRRLAQPAGLQPGCAGAPILRRGGGPVHRESRPARAGGFHRRGPHARLRAGLPHPLRLADGRGERHRGAPGARRRSGRRGATGTAGAARRSRRHQAGDAGDGRLVPRLDAAASPRSSSWRWRWPSSSWRPTSPPH